jgi:uncharacterized membrane protein YeaQ/YmgE (transglycosylase-associated protein family)
MGILSWIILGLVVGVIAKFLMPGKDPGGIFITIILGIAGAIGGGFISSAIGFGKVTGFLCRHQRPQSLFTCNGQKNLPGRCL